MAPKTYDSSLPPLPSTDFDPGQATTTTTTSSSDTDPDCPFCHIARVFPPYDPSHPPPPTSSFLSPSLTTPSHPSTYLILSTPYLIAFLDIMPLSLGHILLCPRAHRPKLTDATPQEAAELGKHLRVLSAAVAHATGVRDWNVVQNNGAAAAQVVPHMHFHVIPRPELRDRRSERFTATMFGRGQRDELDEEEARVLAARVREVVGEVLRGDGVGEGKGGGAKL